MLLDLKDHKIYLYDITFVILTILSITFTGIYCIGIIVPLSPLSNSRTFHHLSQKKSCPHQQSPPSPPWPLTTRNPLSVSVGLPVLHVSHQWSHSLCVLLCLLLSLSIVSSGSVLVVASVSVSLFLVAKPCSHL